MILGQGSRCFLEPGGGSPLQSHFFQGSSLVFGVPLDRVPATFTVYYAQDSVQDPG